MEDGFESVRVVDEKTAIKIVGLSQRTWIKLKARGEAPVKTRLSEYRIGYRISDLRDWLDARRGGEVVCRTSRRRKAKGTEETVTP